jgi:hypothetical protein
MSPITSDEAHELLEKQIGDYFPPAAQLADWYASDDNSRLATVMPHGSCWRYVLLGRESGAYERLAAGDHPTRESAFSALVNHGG